MNRSRMRVCAALAASIVGSALAAGCGQRPVAEPEPTAVADAADRIERGAYLVRFGGCNDCHTPFEVGPAGPVPDMSRELSGHPVDLAMPPAPALPDSPWVWVGAATNTAFAGPWGVSYASNLTPDPDTGMGGWQEETFIRAMRTGRHLGVSDARPILPPMPWANVGQLSDEDLSAIFAYLQSIPSISNRVPESIPAPPVEPSAE